MDGAVISNKVFVRYNSGKGEGLKTVCFRNPSVLVHRLNH